MEGRGRSRVGLRCPLKGAGICRSARGVEVRALSARTKGDNADGNEFPKPGREVEAKVTVRSGGDRDNNVKVKVQAGPRRRTPVSPKKESCCCPAGSGDLGSGIVQSRSQQPVVVFLGGLGRGGAGCGVVDVAPCPMQGRNSKRPGTRRTGQLRFRRLRTWNRLEPEMEIGLALLLGGRRR
ncbi:hypothetical protein VTK26DRAFT_4565 [Humicola hyalothermophila]